MFGKTNSIKAKVNCFLSLTFYFLLLTLLVLPGGCDWRQRTTESPVDLYVNAVMFKELDQPDKAVEKLNLAVKKNENFSLAYSLLGEIYQEIKDYEKSALSYERAAQLNPWSFGDFFNLGRVYQIMKKFTEAVKAYAKACELKPDHLQAHINTAKCYYEIKEYDNALLYGRRAEQIAPDTGELQEILGDIYESKKDHEQAIRSYKRALEVDSSNTRIMTSLAVAYLRTNRNEPAKELLTSVIEAEPYNGKVYRHLGYCFLRFYNKAIESYRQRIEAEGDNSESVILLKKNADKNLEKAIGNYKRAIEINDRDWDAHRGLGVAYVLKSKTADGKVDDTLIDKAIYHWRLSLQINPDQPRGDKLRKLIGKYRVK